jgi:hypothetical protein
METKKIDARAEKNGGRAEHWPADSSKSQERPSAGSETSVMCTSLVLVPLFLDVVDRDDYIALARCLLLLRHSFTTPVVEERVVIVTRAGYENSTEREREKHADRSF